MNQLRAGMRLVLCSVALLALLAGPAAAQDDLNCATSPRRRRPRQRWRPIPPTRTAWTGTTTDWPARATPTAAVATAAGTDPAAARMLLPRARIWTARTSRRRRRLRRNWRPIPPTPTASTGTAMGRPASAIPTPGRAPAARRVTRRAKPPPCAAHPRGDRGGRCRAFRGLGGLGDRRGCCPGRREPRPDQGSTQRSLRWEADGPPACSAGRLRVYARHGRSLGGGSPPWRRWFLFKLMATAVL